MMLRTILVLVVLAAVAVNAAAQTDIYLSTEKKSMGKIPIVVTDIETNDGSSRESAIYITRVLRKDLEFSGYFDPLEFVAGSDTLAAGLTAAAVFEGTIKSEADKFTLEVRLLDYLSRETIFNKRYSFKGSARRKVAHYISDEITYFLVGERGIATTRLLFCRRDGESKDLYLVDYDGHGLKRLTKGELAVSPLWVDPKRLLYTSYKRDNPDCYMIDIAAVKKSIYSHRKGLNVAGDFLPDRGEVLMTLSIKGNSEVYILDLAGKVVQRLTRNRAIDCSPSWAPNGNEVVFVSDRTGSPQIYVMDRFGGNVRRLSRGSYNTSPVWSLSGEMIAYVSRESGLYRLKMATPDGLAEENLFDDFLSYEDPSWAPNSKHIAATVKYGRNPWIVIIDSETGEKRRLVQGEFAAWSPTERGVSED